MRSPPVLVLVMVVLVQSLAGAAAWAATPPADSVPFHCPAVFALDHAPNGSRPDSFQTQRDTPNLVVVGTAKPSPAADAGSDRTFDLTIEETLSGFWPAKTVRISYPWNAEGRAIFHLSPSLTENGGELYLHYTTPVEEIEAASALAAARLDLVVASATSILAGTELPGNPYEDWRKIKVARMVSGASFPEGATIRLERRSRGDANVRQESVPRLFLISPSPGRPSKQGVGFHLISTLPLEMEKAVRGALSRRDRHPLTSVSEQGRVTRFREVLYAGDVGSAVRLTGSSIPAAQLLGLRYLGHHLEDGRELLRREIAATMLRSDVAQGRDFAIQKAYIAALGELDREAPSGAFVELVIQMLTALERDQAIVPLPNRAKRPGKEEAEEAATDVNHSLTWLVSELKEADMEGELEERLLALRDRLDGWWKQEVTLAIETSDLEQNRAQRQALRATAGIRPVHASAGMHLTTPYDSVGGVAVSDDGAYLAASGGYETRIWSAKDGQDAATIRVGTRDLAFAADGNTLTFLDHDGAVKRWDWRTGRIEDIDVVAQPYPSLALTQFSRAGRALLAVSFQDETLRLWDLTKRAPNRQVALPRTLSAGVMLAVALSPDGGKLVRQIASQADANSPTSESIIETWQGRHLGRPLRFDFAVDHHAFTPDGRHLLSVGTAPGRDFMDRRLRVELRDLESGAVRKLKTDEKTRFPSCPVISPGGRYAAFVDEDWSLFLFELPALKLAGMKRNFAIRGLAFSPDERLLFAGAMRPTPLILRTDNLEETFPYTGNPDRMVAAYFSDDNQRLWSVDEPGSLCHWDTATMTMRGRVTVPAGFRQMSIREPDGKYILYTDGIRTAYLGDLPVPQHVLVLKAETGAEISRFPVAIEIGASVFWLPGGELLCINHEYGTSAVTLLDYLGGRLISRFYSPIPIGPVSISQDGRSLLAEPRPIPGNLPPILVNLATGESIEPEVERAGNIRMVNGVPYEELQSPWPAPRMPAVRQVSATGIPSPDGRRLAVITGARLDDRQRYSSVETKPRTARIHDAKTLEMLYALPLPDEQSQVRFNGDGTQLSVVNSDGTIDRWVFPR